MGDSENLHIRCSHGCASERKPLLLLDCKLCIYHAECLPDKCRCEVPIVQQKSRPFGDFPCFVQGCKRPRQSANGVFCQVHLKEIILSVVSKLKILGRMQKRDIESFLKEHRDTRKCQGDLLKLAEVQVMTALANVWQVYLEPDQRQIKYITVRAAELATGDIGNIKEFLEMHNISPLASSLIAEDARAQKHGWKYVASGKVGISLQHANFKTAAELLDHFNLQGGLTYNVSSTIGMYDQAATHVCELIESGVLAFVQNGTLLFRRPPQSFDPWAAVYWRKHVASRLRSTTQNPGHGAD